MNFQNPAVLYTLFALIIPIIVHLFQLRKFKKTPFTNVQFLKELAVKTRKSSQIKKWLLLSARLLTYACIIIAFSQPFFNKDTSVLQEKETVIYLDNSFSMQAKGNKGELFKVAVQELIQSFLSEEKISVLTNTKTYPNTTLSTIKNELIATQYDATQLSYQTVTLKANQLFSKQKNTTKKLILVSDFQKNAPLDSVFFNQNYQTHLIQITPVSKQNISIDSAYFSNDASKLTLHTIINKQQSEANNVPVSVFNNDSLISKTAVSFSETKKTVAFDLPTKQNLKLKVAIQDPTLQQDNTLYITRNIPDKINVLSIGNTDRNKFLKRIFTSDEFEFSQNNPKAIQYSNFEKQNVILWNEIENPSIALLQNTKQFAENGGVVICIPSEGANSNNYNKLTNVFNSQNTNETRVTKINYSHPIFKQVFEKNVRNFQFPMVKKHYKLQQYQSDILNLENGNPLLIKKGNYYIFAAALNSENSNLLQSPIIVPAFYNMAKSSLKNGIPYYIIGLKNEIDITTRLQKDEVLHLKNDQENFIPLQQIKGHKVHLETNNNPRNAGFYSVQNSTNNTVTTLAYNYNRKEGNLEYYNLTTLPNKHLSVSNSVATEIATINSMHKVPSVWKWFVIFALAFLLIELLILKYFK